MLKKTKTIITAIALAFAGVANAQTGQYYFLPLCPSDDDVGPCTIFLEEEPATSELVYCMNGKKQCYDFTFTVTPQKLK